MTGSNKPRKEHDPGSGAKFRLQEWIKGSAVFGGIGNCYRYRLSRVWDEAKPAILFVMMNPSTADPDHDDRTVAKCGRLARRWGYGCLLVGNTFAHRCTDQGRLAETGDPVGPENDLHLLEMAEMSERIVIAYGKPKIKTLQARGREVVKLLRDHGYTLYALRILADGTPGHPLYIREDTELVEFHWPLLGV